MRKSRFTTEQIIGFIKQAEAGMAVSEMGRQHGFSPASFYAWRAKYGGMEAEDAKRLKELETETCCSVTGTVRSPPWWSGRPPIRSLPGGASASGRVSRFLPG